MTFGTYRQTGRLQNGNFLSDELRFTGCDQQPQQQRPLQQGIKHPNSEKARRVAQLTKLRERYRTGPKPETVIPRYPQYHLTFGTC